MSRHGGGARRRAQKRNGCPRTGKITWNRLDFAELDLAKAIEKGKSVKRVYRCRHCAGWHMTSQEAPEPSEDTPSHGPRHEPQVVETIAGDGLEG